MEHQKLGEKSPTLVSWITTLFSLESFECQVNSNKFILKQNGYLLRSCWEFFFLNWNSSWTTEWLIVFCLSGVCSVNPNRGCLLSFPFPSPSKFFVFVLCKRNAILLSWNKPTFHTFKHHWTKPKVQCIKGSIRKFIYCCSFSKMLLAQTTPTNFSSFLQVVQHMLPLDLSFVSKCLDSKYDGNGNKRGAVRIHRYVLSLLIRFIFI